MDKLKSAGFVWRFLSPLPPFWRAHQVGRSFLSPFGALISLILVESQIAEDFVLVDLGCGHGIFLALVAWAFSTRKRPSPQLVGIDLSPDKIISAQKAFDASGLKARELAVKDIADFEPKSANIISILDVLYLVPIEYWDRVLTKCYAALKPGGALLLKEMNNRLKWKFRLLQIEETLSVKILGLTMGGKFTFPTPEDIQARLEAAGFKVETRPLDHGYHVPHMLWIARKAAA